MSKGLNKIENEWYRKGTKKKRKCGKSFAREDQTYLNKWAIIDQENRMSWSVAEREIEMNAEEHDYELFFLMSFDSRFFGVWECVCNGGS